MINRQELYARMKDGAIVLTPTKRLALDLLQQFFHHQGQEALIQPLCLPFQSFLQKRFHDLAFAAELVTKPILLNNVQTRAIWHAILEKELTVTNGLVDAVQDSWAKCQRWRLDYNDPLFKQNHQSARFTFWCREFVRALQKIPAITNEQIVDYLIAQGNYKENKPIIWVCFSELTPQQAFLQEYLLSNGVENYHCPLIENSGKQYLCKAENEEDEFEQMQYWLEEKLKEPSQKIAIITPDLAQQTKSICSVLDKILPADKYTSSLGQSLDKIPLAAQALAFLGLDLDTISNHQARVILHSPYISHAQEEFFARAMAMRDAQSLQEEYCDWPVFLEDLDQLTPALATTLRQIHPYPDNASPEEWWQLFYQRLCILEFPGSTSLDSVNYQCYQRFLKLIDEFRQLQLVRNSFSCSEALTMLNTMAAATLFQPQKRQAQVHIIGLLEAAGCSFDAAWICGMTDEALPAKGALSPFIPIHLQKKMKMPYADMNKELHLAQQLLDTVQAISPEVIYSYAAFVEERVQSVHPQLQNLPTYSSVTAKTMAPPFPLENYFDAHAIPLLPTEKVRGGTSLLTKQAQCPFQAFAALRLLAWPTAETSLGLNPFERGHLLHKILELIWQKLGDQNALLALSEENLAKLIDETLDICLTPYRLRKRRSFTSLIAGVEYNRLRRLVRVCLEWEKQRPAFIVEALEKEFTIDLAGIDIKLRVDRLDRVGENSFWVIDYKSSPPQTLPWFDERPREPQLLLYALLDDNINTLIFAALKDGQLVCKGLSSEQLSFSGMKTLPAEITWSEQRQFWQQSLQQLAEEFKEGQCRPQPLNSSICQRCDYRSLCRFNSEEELALTDEIAVQ